MFSFGVTDGLICRFADLRVNAGFFLQVFFSCRFASFSCKFAGFRLQACSLFCRLFRLFPTGLQVFHAGFLSFFTLLVYFVHSVAESVYMI